MITTIDSAGRIVIPRDIRTQAGLQPGTVVDVELRDGVVSIEPVASPVKIVKRGRLRVAVSGGSRALSEGDVRRVREKMRRRS